MTTLLFLLLLLSRFLIFDSDYALISCPLCKSNILWNILMILDSNEEQDQTTCHIQKWQPAFFTFGVISPCVWIWFLITYWTYCSEIWGYVDMDMKFCKRVSKFKRQTLRACPNLPQFYTDKFSVTTGWSVLKFWDMIDMDMKFCKMVSKGPPRNAPPYSLHKRPNISETLQIHHPPPPLKKNNKKKHNKKKNIIYIVVPYDKRHSVTLTAPQPPTPNHSSSHKA